VMPANVKETLTVMQMSTVRMHQSSNSILAGASLMRPVMLSIPAAAILIATEMWMGLMQSGLKRTLAGALYKIPVPSHPHAQSLIGAATRISIFH
jgi:hypothetical protein